MDNGYNNNQSDLLLTNEALGLPGGDTAAFKKASSRSHLTLFFYILIMYLAATALSAIVMVIASVLENEEIYAKLTGTTANLIISSIAQYLIAFPFAILLLYAFVKPRKYEKTKIKFSELAMLFVIAEAMMLIGSYISNILTAIIGGIFNFTPSNSVDTIINDTPIWLIFIVMVILAPIVEELLFRKLLIDRIGHFGDGFAILISALAFALMHSNLYQFIYAFLVGLIFGYIYTRTRDVRYTVIMHAILNFLGSVVALLVQKSMDRLTEFNPEEATEITPELITLLFDGMVVGVYSVVQYGFLIAGIALLIVYLTKKMVVLNESTGTLKMTKSIMKAALLNPGAILFYVLCLILTVVTLVFGG